MVTVGSKIHFVGSNEDAKRALTKPEQTRKAIWHYLLSYYHDILRVPPFAQTNILQDD